MDGIININKSPGMTSYQVVAATKRLSGERKVGHAGTLDPAASGVLPVCLGKATRTIEYFLDLHKTYLAEIELGVATDSYDANGQITSRGDSSNITPAMITHALEAFSGTIRQTPPMFSALKHQGTPLYRLARAGITIDRPSRPAQIYRIELKGFEPPILMLEVECGRGTYIRSIANDLGEMLGCGGTLKNLVRLKYGPFDIEDAVTLPALEDAISSGTGGKHVHPVDFVMSHIPPVTVDGELANRLKYGEPLDAEAVSETLTGTPRLRVYSPEGEFLGIWQLDADNKCYLAKKVFSTG